MKILGPDILAAVENSCPADTMFSTGIRMSGTMVLTKYHFEEGIAAAVGLAFTQGGHGSESRTGEIMKMVIGYGSSAKPQIPALRELIVSLNAEAERGEFPGGDFNKRRTDPVEEAIKSIEAAKDHPPLRSTK